jgi:hypothetical protein
MQTDTYGCYAADAAKAGIRSACSLVTKEEMQQIVGLPIRVPKPDESKCLYQAVSNAGHYVQLEVHWNDGRDHLDAARASKRIITKVMKKESPGVDPTAIVDGETVSGLGDDAFFMTAGLMPFLHVRKGDSAVTIEDFGGTKEEMIAVARKALSRLR